MAIESATAPEKDFSAVRGRKSTSHLLRKGGHFECNRSSFTPTRFIRFKQKVDTRLCARTLATHMLFYVFKALQGSSRLFKALQGSSRLFKALQGSSRLFKAPISCGLSLAVCGLGFVVATPVDAQSPPHVPPAAKSKKRAPLLLNADSMAGRKAVKDASMPAGNPGRPVIPAGKRRYIVMLQPKADQAACIQTHQVGIEHRFHHALNGFMACLDDATVERMRDDPSVLGIEEDGIVATNGSQSIPTGAKRMAIVPPAKIDGLDERVDVDVAVMDGVGVQADHPDLNVYQTASMWQGYVAGNHGTGCAGIIGALDNDLGIVGVAPGVRIWGINLSGSETSIYRSDIFKGFEYVAAHADEIEVVNCSFGTTAWGNTSLRDSYQQLVRACVEKGVVVVCAAMNSGQDIAGPNGILDDGEITDNSVPAGFPEAMAVSAMHPVMDQFASYSNFSASNHTGRFVISPGAAIDVAAPTGVVTTTTGSSYSANFNGTSAAAPHVTGLVAQYIARHGRAHDAAGVYRIRQAIVDAAQPQSQWQSADTLDPDNNPEGLASARLWPFLEPVFTQMEKHPAGVALSFASLPSCLHILQGKSSLGTTEQWTDLQSLPGNGALSTFTHQPAGLRHYYRLKSLPGAWPQVLPNAALNLGTAGTAAAGTYRSQSRFVGGPLPSEINNLALRQTMTDTGSTVSVPYSLAMTPVGPFSVEIWAKPAKTGTVGGHSPRFMSCRETGRGWSLNQYTTASTSDLNGFNFICLTGTSTSVIAGLSISIEINKWYHVVGVHTGTHVNLYVDGTLAQSVAVPSGQSYQTPLNRGITVGSDNGERCFEGELDEAAIYPHALTAAQVFVHYQAGISAAPAIPYEQVILNDLPVGYWRFNEP